MYYFPYYLVFLNLLSFKHYNTINEAKIINNSPKDIDLWSISRLRGAKLTRRTVTYTASYNYYTKNYEFNGKRYVSYDDLINDAIQM